MATLKTLLKQFSDNIVLVVVAVVGVLLYMLGRKSDKIAELEAADALRKHEAAIDKQADKVIAADKKHEEAKNAYDAWKASYRAKYGRDPDGSGGAD